MFGGATALGFGVLLILILFGVLMWPKGGSAQSGGGQASQPLLSLPSFGQQVSFREQVNREDQEVLAAMFIEKRKAKQREELRKEFVELLGDN
jgi:hypothetical protein